MEECKINETNLLKNIELLRLYSSEERAKLDTIFERANSCLDNYKTDNTGKISSKTSNLKNNVSIISANRDEYVVTLETVVKRYKEQSDRVKQTSKKVGGE